MATELSPATCSRSRGIRGGLAAGRVARPPLLWIAGALAILILSLSGGQIDYPTSQDFPTKRSVEASFASHGGNCVACNIAGEPQLVSVLIDNKTVQLCDGSE